MTLCFATNNAHKLEEVAHGLGNAFTLQTLQEIGCNEELPETSGTIPGNSRQKAEYVYKHYGVSCFADDSGLEVDALNGEPGVDSAFYSGTRDHAKNIEKLLLNLAHETNRRARFRTVFTLILHGVEHQFEGVVEGTIRTAPGGSGGFGYDPVFVPDGFDRTFAEMSLEEKNKISHRARALAGLTAYLTEQIHG
nr:RdgB/HAM1 family non-canonical purine NTP pyrophosphatase [uncultured Arsenicibacter sp.]